VIGSEARTAHRLSAGLVAREAEMGATHPRLPPNVIKALKAKFKKSG
jgi:hypothetical protein